MHRMYYRYGNCVTSSLAIESFQRTLSSAHLNVMKFKFKKIATRENRMKISQSGEQEETIARFRKINREIEKDVTQVEYTQLVICSSSASDLALATLASWEKQR